jgi:thiol:disulfide interchange protein
MQLQFKFLQNAVLVMVLGCAVTIQKLMPQPYGYACMGILIFTFLFNFHKNIKTAASMFRFGVFSSVIILGIAFVFLNYAKSKKPIFTQAFPVKFETASFEASLAKAKAENKKVFIDFYASWCPPCLAFANDILTDTIVGQNMNTTFINLKYDAEQGEGKNVAKKYNVKAYPALMVLDAAGNVIEVVADENVPSKEEMIALAKKYLK